MVMFSDEKAVLDRARRNRAAALLSWDRMMQRIRTGHATGDSQPPRTRMLLSLGYFS